MRMGDKNIVHLALLVDPVNLRPANWVSLNLHSTLRQLLLQSGRSLPCVIVRNSARNVMQNVCLSDSVGRDSSEPAHDRSQVTKHRAVEGCKGTSGEGELGSAVVREQRIGVLQEGDGDKPVVDPGRETMGIKEWKRLNA